MLSQMLSEREYRIEIDQTTSSTNIFQRMFGFHTQTYIHKITVVLTETITDNLGIIFFNGCLLSIFLCL